MSTDLKAGLIACSNPNYLLKLEGVWTTRVTPLEGTTAQLLDIAKIEWHSTFRVAYALRDLISETANICTDDIQLSTYEERRNSFAMFGIAILSPMFSTLDGEVRENVMNAVIRFLKRILNDGEDEGQMSLIEDSIAEAANMPEAFDQITNDFLLANGSKAIKRPFQIADGSNIIANCAGTFAPRPAQTPGSPFETTIEGFIDGYQRHTKSLYLINHDRRALESILFNVETFLPHILQAAAANRPVKAMVRIAPNAKNKMTPTLLDLEFSENY
jgi:hypothetical protein